MQIAGIVFLLTMLDLSVKHAFRFYEDSLNLPIVFVDGYVVVEGMALNYGNAYSPGDSAESVSWIAQGVIYLLTFVGLSFTASVLIDREDSDTWLSAVPFVAMFSGAMGNTIERLIYGNVCDWLTLTRPNSSFIVVMNFADFLIWIGLLSLPFVLAETLKYRAMLLAFFSLFVFWPFKNVIFY